MFGCCEHLGDLILNLLTLYLINMPDLLDCLFVRLREEHELCKLELTKSCPFVVLAPLLSTVVPSETVCPTTLVCGQDKKNYLRRVSSKYSRRCVSHNFSFPPSTIPGTCPRVCHYPAHLILPMRFQKKFKTKIIRTQINELQGLGHFFLNTSHLVSSVPRRGSPSNHITRS